MKIFIEPSDVLMFRDGKPFSGGDDHYARGIFPPSPSTFYGSIRSRILSETFPQYESVKEGRIPDPVAREIGTPSTYGSLAITNFLLAQKTHKEVLPLFPAPKDIVRIKREDKKEEDELIKGKDELLLLSPHSDVSAKLRFNLSEPVLVPLWLKDERPLEEVSGFLSTDIMTGYLIGEVPDAIISSESLYVREERVGIKKDRIRRSAATGALYSVEYFRLKEGVGFCLDLNGVTSLPKEGLLRLGGDHRSAYYKETTFSMPSVGTIKRKVKENKRFKVMLLTPAIFNKGWLPDWVNKETGKGQVNGLELQLVSAAVGKPLSIGGFDLVKSTPKDMKRAVPSGSVYYFEHNEESAEEIFNAFWLKSISSEKQKEGFGITIIGGY